jgi:hypothetical protein
VKRLFLDLETSPNIVLSWRVGWEIKIDAENIIKERAIICAGYKWEGDRGASCITWDANQDDAALLNKIIHIIGEADEVVMHNGDKFDLPWVRARAAFHGLVVPPTKTVDTLQWARRKFNFNSNKLDYIARFLGMGGKIKTEFGLWKEICLNKCPKSLKKMADYCKRDVELLEKVHARLAAFVPAKTHVGVLAGGEKWSCPYTGSKSVSCYKTRITASGTKQFQMKNKDTGRYYQIGEPAFTAYRKYQLSLKEKKK